ncbi:unnamed protein product [Nezara viridula]|uniref:Uncharacterized protein n=1 Tax=Nezara viridula TaxID=85310 RepID=A0A9P0MPX2_NEZVI|nr:unnamed protein product [Nezara viridula]
MTTQLSHGEAYTLQHSKEWREVIWNRLPFHINPSKLSTYKVRLFRWCCVPGSWWDDSLAAYAKHVNGTSQEF